MYIYIGIDIWRRGIPIVIIDEVPEGYKEYSRRKIDEFYNRGLYRRDLLDRIELDIYDNDLNSLLSLVSHCCSKENINIANTTCKEEVLAESSILIFAMYCEKNKNTYGIIPKLKESANDNKLCHIIYKYDMSEIGMEVEK